MEPVVTHQTSWLESTGVCGVQQNQAGGSSGRKRELDDQTLTQLLVILCLLTIKYKPDAVMHTPHQNLSGVGAAFFATGLGKEQAEKQAVQLLVE